ncbi:unannotated protein [freshwater metagenome]|uniref:Unannotated protein n=1 Tax=freshwater metagenome TaxID=449393 RepID=A0A6J7T7G0_9ZZZZ
MHHSARDIDATELTGRRLTDENNPGSFETLNHDR